MGFTRTLIVAFAWEIRWTRYYVAGYEFTELDCRLPFFANRQEPRW